jgi:hypothetical protein
MIPAQVSELEVFLPERSMCSQAELDRHEDRAHKSSRMRHRLSISLSLATKSSAALSSEWYVKSSAPGASDALQQYDYSEDYEPRLAAVGKPSSFSPSSTPPSGLAVTNWSGLLVPPLSAKSGNAGVHSGARGYDSVAGDRGVPPSASSSASLKSSAFEDSWG